MSRGGKRPGAGRKVGSLTKKNRELTEQAALNGITPLEVMLVRMRELWHGDMKDEAVCVAKDAAPYIHPRLASVDATVKSDNVVRVISDEPMSTDDWESLVGMGTAAGATSPTA